MLYTNYEVYVCTIIIIKKKVDEYSLLLCCVHKTCNEQCRNFNTSQPLSAAIYCHTCATTSTWLLTVPTDGVGRIEPCDAAAGGEMTSLGRWCELDVELLINSTSSGPTGLGWPAELGRER